MSAASRHAAGMGIGTGHLAGLHAEPDDVLDALLPLEVEVLADAAQGLGADRLAPAVDPQQPPGVVVGRRVEAEDPVELLHRRTGLGQLGVEAARSVLAAYSKASASSWSLESKW